MCVYVFTRKCAREALKDVVEYLNVENGQVAVSESTLSPSVECFVVLGV